MAYSLAHSSGRPDARSHAVPCCAMHAADRPATTMAGGSCGLLHGPTTRRWTRLQLVWGCTSSSKPPLEKGPFWSALKGVWAGRRPCGQPPWASHRQVTRVASPHVRHPGTTSRPFQRANLNTLLVY